MVLSGRANQVYSFLFSHRNQYTDRQISEWTGLSEPDVDAACLELVSAFDGTRFSLAQEETKWGRAYKLTVHKRPDNKGDVFVQKELPGMSGFIRGQPARRGDG